MFTSMKLLLHSNTIQIITDYHLLFITLLCQVEHCLVQTLGAIRETTQMRTYSALMKTLNVPG